MTRIDPALLVALTSALQTPVNTEKTRRTKTDTGKASAGERRPEGSRSEQLTQLLQQRVRQLKEKGSLSDEDILTIAVQETLALAFGEEIAAHPRFREVTEKIRRTLVDVPEFRDLLPLLGQKARGEG